MSALFLAAGIAHLRNPAPFVAITPEWVPYARAVILVTGALEIAGGIALLTARMRKAAGIGLALYALCVWPANVKHAFGGIDLDALPSSWWYHGPRLALQPLIIWAALFAGTVTDWPFRRRG
nr:DoxX family protein [Breoghania sp. L-A4]